MLQDVSIIVPSNSQSNANVLVVVVVGKGIGAELVVEVVVGLVLFISPTKAVNVASPFTESQHPLSPV